MKKYISGIVLFTLLIFGFAMVPQAEAQQCATFNFFTNTFHVPCFNLDNQSFWLDMGLARSSPAAMVMTNFGVNNPAISDPDCASFDFSTFIFHIPCSYVALTCMEAITGSISFSPRMCRLLSILPYKATA